MGLGLTPSERIARTRTDLRIGVPVLLRGASGLALVAAAETLGADRLADLRSIGSAELAITDWRAQTLKARAYDGDLARLSLPADADIGWIRQVIDPATDLDRPLLGPFKTARGGDATVHRVALHLTKIARLLPAALVVPLSAEAQPDLPPEIGTLDLSDTQDVLERATSFEDVVSGRIPLALAGTGRVHVFRPDDGGDEHTAVEINRPDRSAPVLVRLHSACFTGDVLGSLKCDCGPQLNTALAAMAEAGSGILLYLNQEGRGIGLANKMRAYSLQDRGFDTVEANHRLGFEDDERDFRVGASILRKLGVTRVRLLTNNPAKVAMLNSCGIEVVERVSLKVGRTAQNTRYLDVKARKSGHLL